MADRPAAARSPPYLSKTSAKYAFTTWPKMIGSETFIIVALRWTENSTPVAFAVASALIRNDRRLATCRTVASTTSPASTGSDARSTLRSPAVVSRTTLSVSSTASVTDFSLALKSWAPIVATEVFEPAAKGLLTCGCLRA